MKSFLLLLSCFLLGCSTASKKESLAPDKKADLRGAYTVLYEIVSKQKDLDKISYVKTISPELKPLLKEIADTSEKISKKIKTWVSQDSKLQSQINPLPNFEQQIRKEIEFETTKEIFKASGKELEKILLMKQNEGLNYQASLCHWLSQHETQSARQEELKDFERKFSKLNHRIFELLSVSQ